MSKAILDGRFEGGLSMEARELFAALTAPTSTKFPFLHRRRVQLEQEAIIHQIGSLGEIQAARCLRGFIVPGAPLARAAAGAVNTLLAGCPPEQLPAFVEALRRWWGVPLANDDCWRNLKVDDLEQVLYSPSEFPCAWGMLTGHANGFVREAAVKRLAEHEGGEEVSFLLISANDWVPEIRKLAGVFLRARLKPRFAPALGRNLLLVLRLFDVGRFEDVQLLEDILALLRRDESLGVLVNLIKDPAVELSRAAMDVATRALEAPPTALVVAAVEAGRGHRDEIVRLKALEAASASLVMHWPRSWRTGMWIRRPVFEERPSNLRWSAILTKAASA